MRKFNEENVVKALDKAEEYIREHYDEESYNYDDVLTDARITFLEALNYSTENAINLNKEVKEFNNFSDDIDVDCELEYMVKNLR